MAVFTVLLVLCAAVPVFADPSSQPPPDSSQLGDAEVAPPPGAEAQPALPEEGEVAVGTDESGSIAEVPLELQREPELETPWAMAERQESKLAYADLNPAEEKGLLEQTFEQQLEAISEDPSRMLENATLEQIESPTEALATVEGQPTLIESSVPLRATDSEGKLSKVDLGLEETEHGYAAVNPLVDVQLPQSAAGEIGVGDKGLTLRLQGASSKVKASTTGEGAVFAPEAGEDTSLLMAPISGGLELSAMLSSRESPEQLVFEATLPAGAQLRSASDGGAEVVSPDEEVLYRISASRALDAQGTAVPATMAVKGEEIILQIQHRQMDVAYPIYLDPEITENWTNFTDTSKLNYWNWQYSGVGAEDYIGWRSPIVDNWGNGLYVRSRSNFTYPANSYGRWWIGAPNSTAYFDYVNLTNINFDAHGCTANEPHGYIGVWNDGGYWSAIATAYPSSWYGFASSLSGGSRTIFLGMTAASKSNISCGRDYALNGAVLYLTDPENPTVSAPSGIPSGWIKQETALPITVPVSDPGLGVKRAIVSSEAGESKQELGCTGHFGSTCPASSNFNFSLSAASFKEGERSASFSAEDALGNKSSTQEATLKIDRTRPGLVLKGQLAEATEEEGGEKAEENDEDEFDALHLPVYNLTIEATDGSTENATTKRSGVKSVEVFLDSSKTPLKTWSNASCPGSSCALTATYTLKLNELSADKHHALRVLATDFAENAPREREIGFEYVPATGEKDEYLLQHFKLFDPEAEPEEGVEATGPELAVNLMNGNLVFHQQDLEVPGAAADLEVERFYNSLLPEDQDSEFGDGWTLAQTPTLEPDEAETGPPTEAALLEESGGVESAVTLPTKNGEEEFDPGLQATITKEAGGYSLTDESGEGAPGVLHFDESGQATELETGEYSGVEYNHEGGDLSEIAVEDTASAGLGTPPKEPEWPTAATLAYSATIGTSGTGKLNGPRGVAADGKGHVWVVDRANNRVVEFSETGTYLGQFGSAGSGNGQFNNPWGITYAEGTLWVADTGNYRVQEFNEKGEFLQKFGSKASGSSKGTEFLRPEGIAVTPGGMLWVSDSGGARLAEFRQSVTSESERWVRNTSGATLNEPEGVAVDAAGDVLVADEEEGKVLVFSPEGAYIRSIGTFGTGTGQLRYPTGVAVRPSGTVLVVDAGNNRIEEFSPEGTYLRAFGTSGSGGANFSEPKGIAIGSDGSVFVADKLNNAVKKWMPLEFAYSATIGTSGTGKLNGPRGVAADGKGHVWVVDRANNRVVEFSETGTYLGQFGSAGSGNGQFNNPWGITYAEGTLWVADTGNYRVQAFNTEGKFLQKFGTKATTTSKGTEFLSPEGIAATGSMLWVSDSGGARLAEFRQSVTSESERWVRNTSGATLVEPVGVAVDGSGNVFVADEEESKVFEFGPEGSYVRSIGSFGTGTGQLRWPTGVAVRPSGTVLVVDAGNNRIEEFSPEGTYLRAFGSSGSGGANFSEPKTVAIGSDGSAFVADKANNALKKWGTALTEAEAWAAAEGAKGEDPALAVDVAGGLVEEVEGEGAEDVAYDHEGQLLTDVDGPEGETHYEYDANHRMTKVELPNGSWAEIEYEATYGRVKAVKVSVEGAPAKTTHFEYTDSPSRSTRVVPDGAPATVYDMAADGSFVRWQNATKAPEIEDLGGTLVDPEHRETQKPMEPGVYGLEIKAYSAEGIAKIEVIANGNLQVDEKTCAEDFEKEEPECEHVSDQWVTESADWAPGILNLEVLVTDREGHEASERFWVNVPYTPPPEGEAEAAPTYTEIKTFREEFGLDLDLKGDEEAINDRIFALLRAWNNPQTPDGEVARATSERWGVPLRAVDAAELEWRQTYVEHDSVAVENWAAAHYPGTFAGYYVDQAAGGTVHVGFTASQNLRLGEIESEVDLLAPASRMQTFTTTPTRAKASLEETAEAISAALESNEALRTIVAETVVEEEKNVVSVGAENVNKAEELLHLTLGSGAPIAVHFEEVGNDLSSGRLIDTGRIRAGDRLITERRPGEVGECTSGFGAWEDRTEKSTGDEIRARFVLTAGHCGYFESLTARSSTPGFDPEDLHEVGPVNRQAFNGFGFRTDALAVRVKGGLAPNTIYRKGLVPAPVQPPTRAKRPNLLCFSGVGTDHRECGRVVKLALRTEPTYSEWVYLVNMKNVDGDSGAPVWNPNTGATVGLIQGSPKSNPNLSLVVPLLQPRGIPAAQAPGALKALSLPKSEFNLIVAH